jgi:hypothetical protein
MSIQTTIARAEVRAQETAWKEHKRGCPACCSAARRRHITEGCAEGQAIHAARAEARKALDREREADRQPIPGEVGLFAPQFDGDELRGWVYEDGESA